MVVLTVSPAAIVMNKKRKRARKGDFINDTLCFMVTGNFKYPKHNLFLFYVSRLGLHLPHLG